MIKKRSYFCSHILAHNSQIPSMWSLKVDHVILYLVFGLYYVLLYYNTIYIYIYGSYRLLEQGLGTNLNWMVSEFLCIFIEWLVIQVPVAFCIILNEYMTLSDSNCNKSTIHVQMLTA